jgi:hypothetical protein
MGMARPTSGVPVDDDVVTLPGESGESVEAAYRRLGRELLGLATLFTGSRQAGEELVHDVFVAAIPRWTSIDQTRALSAAGDRQPGAQPSAAARHGQPLAARPRRRHRRA